MVDHMAIDPEKATFSGMRIELSPGPLAGPPYSGNRKSMMALDVGASVSTTEQRTSLPGRGQRLA